jgi:hypothetical protein
VDQGVDEETQEYFSGKQAPSIIGKTGFKQWIYDKLLDNESIESKSRTLAEDIKFIYVVDVIAKLYNLDIKNILDSSKGIKVEKLPCIYVNN